MNLYRLLHERFEPALDRPGLTVIAGDDGAVGVTWTYGDLDRVSARFAAVLRGRGVEPGDRVVVQAPKSAEAVALYLGVLRCGGVHVPLNTSCTEREVAFFVGDASPRIVVRSAAASADDDGRDPRTIPIEDLWREAQAAPADAAIEPVTEDHLAAICYTSGTTGRCKGAMITHRNLTSNALALHQIWGFEPGDILLHALPIFHVHGLFVALHTAFLNASKVLFLRSFDAAEVRRLLPEATILMGVPTFYSRLLTEPGFGRADCENVRLFVSGSAPLPEAVFGDFETCTGHRILERYGMTEAGMITSNPLDGDRVAGTVGFPLPDVEVRVVNERDANENAELPAGEVGMLEVRGPNLFAGYWGLPEKTAEEIRGDGFFVTGDLARLDGEGRVTLVGRGKDLIIAGGFNVYPREVEHCLDEVAGVRESAVIGAPHADLGEGVVAVLVAEKAPVADDALRAALAAELARFKHPRRFCWVDELPRNAMGKVQKNVLRKRYRDAYAG